MQAGPEPDAEQLYAHAACGLLLVREDGSICRANDRFCHWTGLHAPELVAQRRLQDLLTVGGRIFLQTHWWPLLLLQGAATEIKVDFVHRDGHALPALANAVRLEHAGSTFIALSVMVVEDRHRYERELLLARRRADELLALERAAHQAFEQAEGRLRLALSSASLYVWEADVATAQRSYEDHAATLLGHALPRPIGHDEFSLAIDPADKDREALAFAQAMDGRSADYHCVYRLHGVDGKARMVSSAGRRVAGEQGTAPLFVGVLQDVTESFKLRAAAEDRALFAEQMIGIVSHDLRNPLAALKMSAVLLGRSELDADQQRVLGRILTSSDRAKRLVTDLLDFTSARVGQGLRVMPTPVDLRGVVADAVAEIALVHEGRTLEHLHSGGTACVADGDRLAQVVGNLVSNALAYGEAGSVVRVCSSVDAAGIHISVHNAGPAIPSALQQRMFDPMTRGSAGHQGQRSVGLGLYIVRQIVLAHGGEVSVASAQGEGTSFMLRLPQAGTAR